MAYTRFIHVTNNKDERHQLAILADFAELTYSVVVVRFNHTHTGKEYYVVETFPNIFGAMRAFRELIAQHHADPTCYQRLFETIKEKNRLYI